jgi:Zn-dependent M28 family amino/carboxypeptidase
MLTLAWLSAFPLLFSVVGGRNHGTLDNASGVAAVLEAAEQLPPEAHVGVLITDAEEFALAGARAWARTRTPGIAINCDSIDDDGQSVGMFSRQRPQRLTDLLQRAGGAVGETVQVGRTLPGILMDSYALAEAGWETLTLSRGNARTLQRIHTSRETLAAMRGTGISGAARILVHMALELG